jgi:membrane-bound lytic murein transglycosylase A
MRQDPRYVFFAIGPDDGREPAGTAGTPLLPGRSIAIDPGYHDFGGAYWIDADAPILAGAPELYRRLVMALDTGGAIKGPARADLYVGRGAAAGDEAGRVRHVLKLYALVPRTP